MKEDKSTSSSATYVPRLYSKYLNEIVPYFKKKYNLTSHLAVPRLEKIVVSMGIGKALENKNRLTAAANDIALITGQKPLITKARKSIAGFKLRKGAQIGLKVTLRRKRMYDFLERLICIAIPRIRDFRGLDPEAFDDAGNFSMGVGEQLIFPEVSIDKVEFVQGMNITIVVNAAGFKKEERKEKSLELLKLLGMPFRE